MTHYEEGNTQCFKKIEYVYMLKDNLKNVYFYNDIGSLFP